MPLSLRAQPAVWSIPAASLLLASCAASAPPEPTGRADRSESTPAPEEPRPTQADGPPGTVEVRSLPWRAVVHLGDEPLGETPVTFEINAGASERLSFEVVGFAPCTVAVTATPGARTTERIVLVPNVDHPAWVRAGSRMARGDPPTLVGVGAVSGIRNGRLAEAAASNQARTEIQILFSTFTAHLMKRYAQSLPPPAAEPEPVNETPSISNGVRSFVNSTLSTVEVVDIWRYPAANAVYAKAQLDLTAFIKALDAEPDLSEDLKNRIRTHFAAAVEDTAATVPRICR